MAVPAHLTALSLLRHIAHAACLYKLRIQLLVTADAVVHHHLTRQRLGLDGLMLHAAHEIRRVLQAVNRLETIIYSQVLMGHMTIVARGTVLLIVDTSVRGVAPRGIVRCHDVAVDAGRRVIAHKISMRPEQIHKQSAEAAYDARYYQQTHLRSFSNIHFDMFYSANIIINEDRNR